MPFRDEREALLRRAEGLERDLADERAARARSELQRVQLAEELARVRRHLARLAPLASPACSPRAAIGLRGAAMAGVLVVAGLGAMSWAVRRTPMHLEASPIEVAPSVPPVPVMPPPVPLTPIVSLPVPAIPPPPAPPAESPQAAGRTQPMRTEVASAFDLQRQAVRACAGSLQGTAMARVTFVSFGRVTAVTLVDPTFAGTAAGSCMARALRTMRVEPFSNPSLTVTYPFVIR